jgi:inhibitor of KinA
MADPHVDRVGDAALLVTLGDELDLALNARAHRIAEELAQLRAAGSVQGIGTPVPGHASVLVPFDPDLLDESTLRTLLGPLVARTDAPGVGADAGAGAGAGAGSDGRLHVIPVRYGGEDGPDLPEVAARTGLTEDEVVRLHSSMELRVLVLGFVPGFPYLGLLPATLDVPRRPTPRVHVPAGSVAIAGLQSVIYPFETPGGWNLIGRTETPIWDPRLEPPALLAPGDRVRFVPA